MGTKGTWRRPAAISRQEEAERWARISPPCPLCHNPDLTPGIAREWKPCWRHRQLQPFDVALHGPKVAEPAADR